MLWNGVKYNLSSLGWSVYLQLGVLSFFLHLFTIQYFKVEQENELFALHNGWHVEGSIGVLLAVHRLFPYLWFAFVLDSYVEHGLQNRAPSLVARLQSFKIWMLSHIFAVFLLVFFYTVIMNMIGYFCFALLGTGSSGTHTGGAWIGLSLLQVFGLSACSLLQIGIRLLSPVTGSSVLFLLLLYLFNVYAHPIYMLGGHVVSKSYLTLEGLTQSGFLFIGVQFLFIVVCTFGLCFLAQRRKIRLSVGKEL